MKAYDIGADDEDDLFISGQGDFAIRPSDKSHVSDILQAFPGWWKQYPLLGVGMARYVNSTNRNDEITRSVNMQLQADKYRNISVKLISLDINNIEIQVNADRI